MEKFITGSVPRLANQDGFTLEIFHPVFYIITSSIIVGIEKIGFVKGSIQRLTFLMRH